MGKRLVKASEEGRRSLTLGHHCLDGAAWALRTEISVGDFGGQWPVLEVASKVTQGRWLEGERQGPGRG